jgi:hypothetical protein
MSDAFIREARETFDSIAMMVSYVILHGVGEQPPPSPDGPQVMRVAPEEFWRIFSKIGEDAAAARDKAEGILAEREREAASRGEATP